MSVNASDATKKFSVRTYAADLAANREKTGTPVKATAAPKVKPAEVKKVTAAPTTKPTPVETKKVHPPEVPKATVPTPPTTQIPPFHALKMPGPRKAPVVKTATAAATTGRTATTFDAEALQAVAGKQTASTLTTQSHGILVGDAEKESRAATIITDTKHKRFSLRQSLVDSISSWVEDKKDTITGKKKPKYSVPQADRRKGVIQKATSLTGRASTADHAQVLERLRSNKKSTPAVITKPAPVKNVTPNWENEPTNAPTTTPAAPIKKEEGSTVNLAVAKKPDAEETKNKVILPTTPIEIPEIVSNQPAPITAAPPEPVPPPVVHTAPAITPIVPTLPQVPPPVVVPDAPPQTDTVPEVTTEETARPVIRPVIPKTKSSSRLEEWLADTNQIVLGGAVMMVSLVILWGIATVVVPRIMSSTAEPVPVPQLFTTSVQQQLPLETLNRTDLLTELVTVNLSSQPLVEVIPVAASTTEPIGGSDLFSTITPTVPIAFAATITTVTPGTYRNEPWLALTVVDTSTTLGGMLQWEEMMSEDLSPWFGEPIRGGEFKDDVIAGVDVRILSDNTGTKRIIYGFIRPQVLLITTSENSFLNLTQNK